MFCTRKDITLFIVYYDNRKKTDYIDYIIKIKFESSNHIFKTIFKVISIRY